MLENGHEAICASKLSSSRSSSWERFSQKNYLRAGVHQPKESATNFYIPPNVELTWDYGEIYDNYKN
jgi:hypothetical protein